VQLGFQFYTIGEERAVGGRKEPFGKKAKTFSANQSI